MPIERAKIWAHEIQCGHIQMFEPVCKDCLAGQTTYEEENLCRNLNKLPRGHVAKSVRDRLEREIVGWSLVTTSPNDEFD